MAMGTSVGDARGGGLNVPGNVRASALRPECGSVGCQPARVTFNSFRLSV